MTTGDVLQLVGVALQAIGLAVAALGLSQNWLEHRTEGVGFWAFYTAPSRRLASALSGGIAARARRLFRRPQHVNVQAGTAQLSLGGNLRARVLVGFGPLDTDDLPAALRELERRINDVNARAGRDTGRIEDAVEGLGISIRDATARLDAELADLRVADRRIAISGLRPAVTGLSLNALGLLLTAFGLFLG